MATDQQRRVNSFLGAYGINANSPFGTSARDIRTGETKDKEYSPTPNEGPIGPRLPDGSFYTNGRKMSDFNVGTKSSSKSSSKGGSSKSSSKSGKESDAYKKMLKKTEKLINKNYKEEEGYLSGLEGTINQRYGTARQNLLGYQPQLEKERTTQLEAVQNEENARVQENRSALQQVRQLLADQQRRAQAYLSATGNHSSSIPQVQGEMFSRYANQNLANVQQQRAEQMATIANKRQQVYDFFSRKAQELQDSLAQLEEQHMAQLDAISNARTNSKKAKNQANLEAWQNYTNQRAAIEEQLMNVNNQWQAVGGDTLSMDELVNQLGGQQTEQITAPPAGEYSQQDVELPQARRLPAKAYQGEENYDGSLLNYYG